MARSTAVLQAPLRLPVPLWGWLTSTHVRERAREQCLRVRSVGPCARSAGLPVTAAAPPPNYAPRRLQIEVRERDRKLDTAQKEMTALKSQVAAKER